MYVKTFVSDTLDGAFKQIKKELGPEAIILKTVSNKGIKGAFKKNRIEITAGITEKDYLKKARVDAVLNEEQKEQFYQGDAQSLSHMIDEYDRTAIKSNPEKEKAKARAKSKAIAKGAEAEGESEGASSKSYGKLGLNKAVNQKKSHETPAERGGSAKDKLDDFLAKMPSMPAPAAAAPRAELRNAPPAAEERTRERPLPEARPERAERTDQTGPGTIMAVAEKIDELEKKMWEISYYLNQVERDESEAVRQWGMLLRGMDLSPVFIQRLIKKALFELPAEDLTQLDLLMDYTMREMTQNIEVELPLFSSTLTGDKKTVTILLSENSCGQSSMAYKMGHMAKDSFIIVHGPAKTGLDPGEKTQAIGKFLNMEVANTGQLATVVTLGRKALAEGKHVIIDYRSADSTESAKIFRDGMRKCFEHVETLLCLSALHSEIYNKSMVKKYSDICEGTVFTYLDACLDYAPIFNVQLLSKRPIKLYGTGSVVPEDIEAASSERILARIFDL